MARKDDDFTAFDVADATPEAPPGYEEEDIFRLEPPVEINLQERNEALAAFKSQIRADSIEKFPDDTDEQIEQRVRYAIVGRTYDPSTFIEDQSRIVGDPLDTNLFLTPSVVSLRTRAGASGTIPIFDVQLQRSQEMFEGLTFGESVAKFADAITDPDPDPATLLTGEQAQELRIVDENFELIRERIDEPEILGIEVTPERLEALTLATTAVGTGVGAIGGFKAAGPVGLVGGGLLGGLTGFGLGSASSLVLGGLSALPEEYSSREYAVDLTKRLYTLMGIPDDMVGFLAVSSPAVRDEAVNNIVELAEYLGVEKVAEWARDNEVNSADDLRNKGSESIRKLEAELEQQDIVPTNFFTSLMATRSIREFVNFVGDDFLLGLHEIVDEVGRSDEYKEMRSQVRKDFLVKRKADVDALSRKQKPTDDDWVALDRFHNVDVKIEKEDEIKPVIQDWIDSSSYNSLPPELRGEMPDLSTFIEFARQIKEDHPMFQYDLPPDVMGAIKAVHDMSATDAELQSMINAIPTGVFRHSFGFPALIENTTPDFDAVKAWANETNRYLNEETGARATRITEKEALGVYLKPVQTDDHGVLMKRSTMGQLTDLANAVPTLLSEVEVGFSPTPTSKPLFESLGLPNGIALPTGAGLDRMGGIGIRPPNSSYFAKAHARLVTGTGGFGVAFNEIARSKGLKPGDFGYNFANLTGGALDMMNVERGLLQGVKRAATMTTGAAKYASRQRFYAPGFKNRAFQQEVMGSTTRDKNVDPVLNMRNILHDQAIDMTNRNVNPLQRPKGARGNDPLVLTAFERATAEKIADAIGVDFKVVLAAFEQVTRQSGEVSRSAEAVIRKLGNHRVAAFRSSPAFGNIRKSINDAVSQGRISADDGATFLAQIEHRAFKAADDTRTPFNFAEQVIDGLEVRFLDEGPDVNMDLVSAAGRRRLQGDGDVPASDFQYDAATGKAVLSIFKDGKIDDLWSADSQLLIRLTGPEFSQKLIKMFDHTVDDAGVATLTKTGSDELSSAWTHYRRTKSLSDTYTSDLMHNLWFNLHHFFSKLRKRPGLLPRQVREYWDLEFGELPQDRYAVQAIVSDVRRRNRDPIIVSGTEQERSFNDRKRRVAAAASATEMNMSLEALRSYFGLKMRVVVDEGVDARTGQRTRSARQTFDDFAYDPIDIGHKIYALIRVQEFRKAHRAGTDVTVGTERFSVPKFRVPAIIDKQRQMMTDAMGLPPDEIGRRTRGRNFAEDGERGFTDIGMGKDIEGVTQADITAFANRIREREAMPLHRKAQTKLQTIINTEPFLVLEPVEQAGLKTLLQELGKSPLSNNLPISLLDPDANLTILSVNEFNKIIQVVQDTAVSPLHRLDRNSVHPGYLANVSQYFAMFRFYGVPYFAWVSSILDFVSEKFLAELPKITKKNADPAFVAQWDKWLRSLADVPNELARLAEAHPSKFPFEFYKDMVEVFVPRIALESVDQLFRLTDLFEGYKTRIDADTRRAFENAETADARPFGFRVPKSFEIADDPVTLPVLYKELYAIQNLLDGFHGMTRQERKSLQALRQLKIQKVGLDDAPLTQEQMNIIAESVQILMTGLQSKRDYVVATTNSLFARAVGDLDANSIKNINTYSFSHETVRKLYKDFYTGNMLGVKAVATTEKDLGGLIAKSRDVYRRSLEEQKAFTKESERNFEQYGDELSMMTNILVYMKQDEMLNAIGKQLSDLGFAKFRRQIVDTLDPVEGMPADRAKYTDLVAEFIRAELRFDTKTTIVKTPDAGDKVIPAGRPVKDALGVFEEKYIDNRNQAYTRFENEARFEAGRILDSLGLPRAKGDLAEVFLGDKKFLIPDNLLNSINEIFEQTNRRVSTTFFGKYFERNIGENNIVFYKKNESIPDTFDIEALKKFSKQELSNTLTMIGQLGDLVFNPSTHYRRLLIGVGGLPMLPYAFSMFVGGLSQIHAGLSTKAAGRVAAETLRTPIELAADKMRGGGVNFSAGVVARMFGHGKSNPDTRPHVTPDGRIFTAEHFANNFIANGFNKSFAASVASPQASNRIRDAFFKAHPEFTAMRIGGVMGSAIGLMNAGPVGAATGMALGSAGGLTIGKLLSPNNPVARLNNFYREVFNSIDLISRISIARQLVDEGQSLQAAATGTRKIALDYSQVSAMDKEYFKAFFAFWTYFSQASQLFARTLVENPDKIIAQLKLARNSQLQALDFEDPELGMAPYDKTRVTLPFMIGGKMVRLPYMLVADILQLLVELVSSIGVGVGPLEQQASLNAVFNRANPFISQLLQQAIGRDPRGFDLDRATFQVPSYIVQLDDDITGGALRDSLDIQFIPYGSIKRTFADDEGKYINPEKLETPGHGIYVANNKKRAAFFLNFLQTPFTGRAGKMLEAVARSNIGVIESGLQVSDFVRDISGDKPALAYIPGAVELGFARDKRQETFVRPSDRVGGFDLETATQSVRMGQPFTFVSSDGTRISLPRVQFFPLEGTKILLGGLAPNPVIEKPINRALRGDIETYKTKTDKQ
tara:strand:+ start:105 stop:7634 length:7530 start_codon:yes stop_codon:yes gene_type:complete